MTEKGWGHGFPHQTIRDLDAWDRRALSRRGYAFGYNLEEYLGMSETVKTALYDMFSGPERRTEAREKGRAYSSYAEKRGRGSAKDAILAETESRRAAAEAEDVLAGRTPSKIRSIKTRTLQIAKSLGYTSANDPRLKEKTRFGLMYGKDVNQMIIDTEAIGAGYGQRPYEFAIGKVDRRFAKDFIEHKDIFIPRELIYEEQIVAELARKSSGRHASQSSLNTRPGLDRRFRGDFYRSRTSMGLSRDVIDKQYALAMEAYDTLMDANRSLPMSHRNAEAAQYVMRQFTAMGLASTGKKHIIAANAAYDMGNIYEETSLISRSIMRASRNARILDEATDTLIETPSSLAYKSLNEQALAIRSGVFGLRDDSGRLIRHGAYVTDLLQAVQMEDFPGKNLPISASLQDALKSLGLDISEQAHGALEDIKETWRGIRTWRKRATKRVRRGGKRTQPYTLLDIINKAAEREYTYKRSLREPLAYEVQEGIKRQGGSSRFRIGSFAGVKINEFRLGERGRFGVGLAIDNGPEVVTPINHRAEKLIRELEETQLKPNSQEARAVRDLVNSGQLSDPEFLDNLIRVHSRVTNKSLYQVLQMTKGYQTIEQRVSSIVTRGGTLDDLITSPLYDNADEVTKRHLLSSATINARYEQFGKAIFGDKLFDFKAGADISKWEEASRNLKIRQFEAYLKPFEQMKDAISVEMYNRVGLVRETAPEHMKKVLDFLSTEIFSQAQDVIMRGASGDIGPMSAIGLRDIKGAKFSNSIAWVGGQLIDKNLQAGTHGISTLISSLGLAAEEELAIKGVLKETPWGELGSKGFASSGIEARFNALSPFFRTVLNRVLPTPFLQITDTLENAESAGGVISDLNRQLYLAFRTQIQTSGAEVSQASRGSWSLRAAAGSVPDDVINSWPEEFKQIHKRLTTNVNPRELFTAPSVDTAEKFVAEVMRSTNQSFDLRSSVNAIITGGSDIGWGETVEQMAAQRAFANEADNVSRIEFFRESQLGQNVSKSKIGYKTTRKVISNNRNWSVLQEAVGKSLYGGMLPVGGKTPYIDDAVRMFQSYFRTSSSRDHFSMLAQLNEDLLTKAARLPKMGREDRIGFFSDLFSFMFTGTENPASIMVESDLPPGVSTTRQTRPGRFMVPVEGEILKKRMTENIAMWNALAGRERVASDVLASIPMISKEMQAAAMAETREIGASVREGIRQSSTWDISRSFFGFAGEGDIAADIVHLPGVGVIDTSGRAMEHAAAIRAYDESGNMVARIVGRNEGEEAFRVAAQMTHGGRDIHFEKGLTGGYLTDIPEEINKLIADDSGLLHKTNRVRPSVRIFRLDESALIPTIDTLTESVIQQDKIDDARHAQITVRAGMAGQGPGPSGPDIIADLADEATAGGRGRMRSVTQAISQMPGTWKVVAAGIAGAAAITMLRKSQPMVPGDNGTYGAMNTAMAYPMGYNPVGDPSTYMAPPPTQGMRASISGMMGADFNVADIQSLFGQMGMANININDNSRSISSRDIDRMMRSNL